MIKVKFYRDDKLVRTEECSNEFEADLIAEKDGKNYTKVELEYEKKDKDVIR